MSRCACRGRARPAPRGRKRVVRVVGIAAALCCLPGAAPAQQGAIQGIVAASETGLPLEDVAVTLEVGGQPARRVFTDRDGFYQIADIAPGTYTLRGERIGYQAHEEVVEVAPGQRRTVSFSLEESAVVVEGIVVSPEKGAVIRDLGRQVVTPTDLGLVPVPAGTGDLATYLQTLPGVTTTGDRGGQLFVRGGASSENLVLVDGIPIYRPFHILGFFSAFPEDLVSRADFYAGGFGPRYQGRTSSVLDVRLREADPNGFRATASASPFIAEAVLESPNGPFRDTRWLLSARRSLVEETSGTFLGTTQPLSFDSEILKLTTMRDDNARCSLLALHTADRGRLDPEETESHVGWNNLVAGLGCTGVWPSGQLLEMHLSYSESRSSAVALGASHLRSRIWRLQHDLHATGTFRSVPVRVGYETYLEAMTYDLTELFLDQTNRDDWLFGGSAYVEATVPAGSRIEVRPGLVVAPFPHLGLEPRVRARWEPFGRSTEALQGALGLYRQHVIGTSDMRDVSSVFLAWMTPEEAPLKAVHATLGWQQSFSDGLRWSLEGYYKRLWQIAVPVWEAVARFTTLLGQADGETYGADARVEYSRPGFYGFLGYGYGWTLYEVRQAQFATWFGEPAQSYHPPHDRRHQLNVVTSLDVADFKVSARWQLGSGLPFTRPLGFDEAFNFPEYPYDVHTFPGITRFVVDKPFTGRLPTVHRLDVSVERRLDLPFGTLVTRAGVINAYDRRNMFYYDLFTGRRLDQLPLAPWASLTLESGGGT